MPRPYKGTNAPASQGSRGNAPGRFKGDMRIQGEVRGEIEIPPPLLGPSGAGREQPYLLR